MFLKTQQQKTNTYSKSDVCSKKRNFKEIPYINILARNELKGVNWKCLWNPCGNANFEVFRAPNLR